MKRTSIAEAIQMSDLQQPTARHPCATAYRVRKMRSLPTLWRWQQHILFILAFWDGSSEFRYYSYSIWIRIHLSRSIKIWWLKYNMCYSTIKMQKTRTPLVRLYLANRLYWAIVFVLGYCVWSARSLIFLFFHHKNVLNKKTFNVTKF
jgi:hypothetical protein